MEQPVLYSGKRLPAKIFALAVLLAVGISAFSQLPPKPYGALPTAAQLQWHEMEMYVLVHYGVDTYTDKEWGYGDESPELINPSNFSAEQIVSAAKAGGFKGVIVVAKHHDGLALWPTKTTSHNISKSPWKDGKGDMVKEYQLACQKLGMKLGVYCSPWDRNDADYGTPAYVERYREQLKELYSNYGPLFISWHDGANGGDGYYGGANEKRIIDRETYYGWDTTFAITRRMQPSAIIFGDIGPDVRWVGNEEGHAGETSWATYTPEAPDEGKKPSNGYVKYWLGVEGTLNGKYWMPAECDVPLRPGWFYHASQDEQVKSPYTLLDLYYKSVGRGANLDLGIAPNQEGVLHVNDVKSLEGFGQLLKKIFSVNLAKGAVFTASNVRGKAPLKFGTAFLTDADRYTYWATDDSILTPELLIDLRQQQTFNVIRLRENIKLGQSITSFAVDALQRGEWKEIAQATSIGPNRLIRLPQNVTATKLRLRIISANASIALSDFGLFKEPPHVSPPLIRRDKNGYVQLITEAPVSALRYTTDNSEPGLRSPMYSEPILLPEGGIVKARSFDDKLLSDISSVTFGLYKKDWTIKNAPASETGYEITQAIDENRISFYQAKQPSGSGTQDIVIDLGKNYAIKSFTYLPRQDKKTGGLADKYVYWVSNDGKDWKEIAAGEFANIKANPVEQVTQLTKPVSARYFKFSAIRTVDGAGLTVGELGVRLQ